MTIAALWGYGDWRHVATGSTALVQTNWPNPKNYYNVYEDYISVLVLHIYVFMYYFVILHFGGVNKATDTRLM